MLWLLLLALAVHMRDVQWYPALWMLSHHVSSPLHAYSQVPLQVPQLVALALQHSGVCVFPIFQSQPWFLFTCTPMKCFLSWLINQSVPQSGVASLLENFRPALVQVTQNTSPSCSGLQPQSHFLQSSLRPRHGQGSPSSWSFFGCCSSAPE